MNDSNSNWWLDFITECQKRGKDYDSVSEEIVSELQDNGYSARDVFHIFEDDLSNI